MGCSVYLCWDEHDRLLYVGITNTGLRRYAKHREESDWWPRVARIDVEHYTTRDEANDRERRLVREREPIHNVQYARTHLCSTCGTRLRWQHQDAPAALVEYDGRWYQGDWYCADCEDYDPYVAAPLSAALPAPPDVDWDALERERIAAFDRIREALNGRT